MKRDSANDCYIFLFHLRCTAVLLFVDYSAGHLFLLWPSSACTAHTPLCLPAFFSVMTSLYGHCAIVLFCILYSSPTNSSPCTSTLPCNIIGFVGYAATTMYLALCHSPATAPFLVCTVCCVPTVPYTIPVTCAGRWLVCSLVAGMVSKAIWSRGK